MMPDTQYFYLYALIFPAIHLAGLVVAMHAVLNVRTSQGATAWGLALLILPYVAIPLYWIFGPRKFLSYMSELDKTVLNHRVQMEAVKVELTQHRVENGECRGQALLENLAQLPVTSGNCVQVLQDGKQAFNEIFSALRAAQEYIFIEFYIVRDDSLGVRLLDLLVEKAAEGVQIYFLADSIGSIALDGDYANRLRQHGVNFEWFGSRKKWSNRFHINFRNHRKIIVVDGVVGFTGGLNVGEEYISLDKKIGHWRDTHLKLSGPAILGLQSAFIQDWSWACDSPPKIKATVPAPVDRGISSVVISTSPADRFDTGLLLVLQLVSLAARRVWIATPYFVPDEGIINMLQVAALKGVDVRILLPANPDHLFMGLASWTYFEDLLAAGVKIYRYRSGFMHQKVILVDDDLTSIGTLNIDNRSLRLNFETAVVSFGTETASHVAQMLKDDFVASDLVVLETLKRRSLAVRVVGGVCRLFAPIL